MHFAAIVVTASLTAILLHPIAATALHIQKLSVIRSYPHDPSAFTEGLCFAPASAVSAADADATTPLLLESTGLWRHSTVRVTNLHTGQTLRELRMPEGEFGEGIAIIAGSGAAQKLVQLTYQNGTAYEYQLLVLFNSSHAASVPAVNERAGKYPYPPFVKEGWGLASWPGSDTLIMSDGTNSLHVFNAGSFRYVHSLPISLSHASTHHWPATEPSTASPLSFNELELLSPTLLLANLYPTRCLALIDLASARLLSVIQADDAMYRSQFPALEVMNGIAYRPANGSAADSGMLLVTGKRWPAMYEVRIVEQGEEHRDTQQGGRPDGPAEQRVMEASNDEKLRTACPVPAWTAAEAQHARFVLNERNTQRT